MKRNNSGFTLVEILVAIAIIGIIAAVAAPPLIDWREKARFTGTLQSLTANLQRGKIAAIRDNAPCQVLLTANDYTIFLDLDSPPNQTWDAGTDLMIKQEEWPTGYTITFTADETNFTSFFFDGRGIVTFQDLSLLAPETDGRITIHDNSGRTGFVRINMLGRVGQVYQ